MKSLSLIVACILTLTSCHHSQEDKQAVKFYDDGRAKAVVTLVPVYDQHDIKLPWSLADDLTDHIKERLVRRGNSYLTSLGAFEFEDFSKQKTPTDLHQGNQMSLAELKKKYPASEFVILLELAQHQLHPKLASDSLLDKITPSMSLDLAMRIRIIDLRGDHIGVILQELVEQSHSIPKQLAKMDYGSSWGKKTYSITPVGFAHMQFAKEVADRIDSYLILAKTR